MASKHRKAPSKEDQVPAATRRVHVPRRASPAVRCSRKRRMATKGTAMISRDDDRVGRHDRSGASVPVAARLLARHGIKRLPVVEENRLVGIVSRADLLRLFLRDDEAIHREIVDEVLLRALWIDPGTVLVTVRDGVVTEVWRTRWPTSSSRRRPSAVEERYPAKPLTRPARRP
jgi:hypothetical protein